MIQIILLDLALFNEFLTSFMTKKVVKCPHCENWVEKVSSSCPSCHSLLDRNEILHEQRKAEGLIKIKDRKPGVIDKWIERTADTKNPFLKVVRYLVMMLWFTYLGLLAFVIWFVTMLAG